MTKKELYAAYLEAKTALEDADLACEKASNKEKDAIARGNISSAPTFARRRDAYNAMAKAFDAFMNTSKVAA